MKKFTVMVENWIFGIWCWIHFFKNTFFQIFFKIRAIQKKKIKKVWIINRSFECDVYNIRQCVCMCVIRLLALAMPPRALFSVSRVPTLVWRLSMRVVSIRCAQNKLKSTGTVRCDGFLFEKKKKKKKLDFRKNQSRINKFYTATKVTPRLNIIKTNLMTTEIISSAKYI